MKTYFSALSNKSIEYALDNGMNLCDWKCQGAEGNEPMAGFCRFSYHNGGVRCERISGDELAYGGFTSDGFMWLGDYDYIVFGLFSKEK